MVAYGRLKQLLKSEMPECRHSYDIPIGNENDGSLFEFILDSTSML